MISNRTQNRARLRQFHCLLLAATFALGSFPTLEARSNRNGPPAAPPASARPSASAPAPQSRPAVTSPQPARPTTPPPARVSSPAATRTQSRQSPPLSSPAASRVQNRQSAPTPPVARPATRQPDAVGSTRPATQATTRVHSSSRRSTPQSAIAAPIDRSAATSTRRQVGAPSSRGSRSPVRAPAATAPTRLDSPAQRRAANRTNTIDMGAIRRQAAVEQSHRDQWRERNKERPGRNESGRGHVDQPRRGDRYSRHDRLDRHGRRDWHGEHRHHAGCGHYFHSGGWHSFSRRHTHHPGCGHHFHGGHWHDFPRGHIHSRHCGHFYDGSRWVISASFGHVHGIGCGHHYFDGYWHAYPRNYYRIYRPGAFFFFVDLGDYRARRIPSQAYTTYYAGQSERDVFTAEDAVSRAYAAFGRGSYYKAVVEFKRALQGDPDNGLLYLARAQAHFAIGDYKAAYYDLVEGMRRIPEWVDVDLNITELYSNPDALSEHLAALEDWVDTYPDDPHPRFVLGYLYFFLQDPAAAKDEMVHVLAWDPDHEQAKLLMDRILAMQAGGDTITRERSNSSEREPVTRE